MLPVKLCPALRKLAFGTVLPGDCVTKPQPYGQGCVMKCAQGYQIDNSSPLTCGIDGQWKGTFPTCKGTNFILVTNHVNNKDESWHIHLLRRQGTVL